MNPVIPEPAADAPIINWAKPVTRALTALADRTGAAARNERGAALPKLRPWEIHFFPAQTQEDEDFWGVYLPAGSLNIAGEELTPTNSSGTTLDEAGAAYPGYYIIPVASGTSPSAFWLHVYTSEGTGGTSYRATVGASDTASPGTSEETLTSIRLCSIASSGAITQLIVGAIALGGGGASGTITYLKAIRYDASTQQIQAIAETYDLATGQTTVLEVLPNPVDGWLMIPGGQAERAPICECNSSASASE